MSVFDLSNTFNTSDHRKTTYYVSQGRAIRRMVVLYDPIEDLIAENDRRCENMNDGHTVE